ncbi:MAG: hypothetical protein U0230_11530 [Polyangiales bacterium]
MFDFLFRAGRVRKAVAKLLDTELEPASILAEVALGDREEVVIEGLRKLEFEERDDRALALAHAVLAADVATPKSLLAADALFATRGDADACVRVCERALRHAPESIELANRLAMRLVEAGDPEEALVVLDGIARPTLGTTLERACALVALDRPAEALPLLELAMDGYEGEMRLATSASAFDLYREGHQRASDLHHAVHGRLVGPEAGVVRAARAGKLDPHAGVNYRLLAESLMVGTPHVPERTELERPERILERLAGVAEASATTLAKRGEAELRLGKSRQARRSFEAACAADGTHFAGFRGIGAVLDHEAHGLFEAAGELPEVPLPPLLPEVVPDWDALTPLERRVVVASVAPLRAVLPRLAAVGAEVRLLPIDVRTVDLEVFRDYDAERFEDDDRALAALGGVAGARDNVALSRIEELLDVESERGFVFAHELAHLAYFHLPEALRERVRALHRHASELQYVAIAYQLSDEHEFFACAYQDYLRLRYGRPLAREADPDGVFAATVALFDDLAGLDAL